MQHHGKRILSVLLIILMLIGTLTPAASALSVQDAAASRLDPSSETYAQDKMALCSSPGEGNAPLLYGTDPGFFSTSYIQGYVHSNGQFNIGTTAGECLLFGFPGGTTSQTLIRIASRDYFFHEYVTDVSFSADGKSCTAIADIGDITVKQILSIIRNPNSTTENVISIQYMLENNSSDPVDVGVRIMMDTMLGNNDGAPFKVKGASITTEREYTGNAIPQIYQATDSLSNPNLTATGYLYYSSHEKPDKVQFAHWGSIYDSPWDYQVSSYTDLTGDSAVAIYFNEEALPGMSCRSVVTYYGAYDDDTAAAYDSFPYTNDQFYQDLAEQCARYSALAYQDYKRHPVQDLFYEDEDSGKKDTEKNNRSKVLNDQLSADGFQRLVSANYASPTEDSATYTLGHKKVNHNGDARDLIVVVIRGTNKDEWKGNMNVTGTSYNAQDSHYSFQKGATQIQSHLMRYLNTYTDIQSPMVLITGHSRGGAIGNLLAADLTNGMVDRIDASSIFAYLFAVPNATTAYDTSMSNIYNFCFTDDFVPSLPLNTNWNYGKHGTTYTVTADGLDTGTFQYREAISIDCSEGLKERDSFDAASTRSVVSYVAKNWKTVSAYYNQAPTGGTVYRSLYSFMHDLVAPAAMGNAGSKIGLLTYTGNESSCVYSKIANFFVDGLGMRDSINDTHQMYTYYNALTAGAFPTGTAASVSAPALNAPTLNADPANAELEQAALAAFAGTEGNLDILGWDLSDITTWDGITWSEDDRVAAIDLCYRGLTGSLDLSSFDALGEVDISGNEISALVLPDASSSVLTWLDCGYNKLTDLDILGQPLETLICCNNYLDPEAIAENASSVTFSSFGSQYSSVDIPYSSADCTELKDKVLTNADIWDLTETPDNWFGVTWDVFDGEYRVISLDISDCGLSGKLDVSGLSKLESLNCSSNNLTSIDASLCDALSFLNCNNNQITDISLSLASALYQLSCSDNCLDEKSSAGLKADNINLGHQYVNAPVSSFCAEEYAVLMPIAQVLGEDADAPGSWSFVTWTAEEGLYHTSGLDLAHQNGLTGSLDLSGFGYLQELSLTGTGFDSVTLPDTMTAIGDRAFFGCTGLTDVVFPAQLQSIGRNAFDTCLGLEHLYFPASLSSIGNASFRLCANLKAAYFTGNAPECGSNAFMYTSAGFTVYHLPEATGWDNEVWNSYIMDTVDLLSILTYPERMSYYINEELDLTGLVLLKLDTTGRFLEITEGYQVSDVDMTTPGTKTVTLTYDGQTTGFDILVTHPSILDFYRYLEYDTVSYDGTEKTPQVYIQRPDGTFLTEGTDFTVVYHNNVEPGYASVEITGINFYSGTDYISFRIVHEQVFTVTDWTELESDHNYSDNCYFTWIYEAKDPDTQHLQLTFSPETRFEHGGDNLTIIDETGNIAGRYTGSQLAGRTVFVSGKTVTLELTTDPSVTDWGFRVADLQEMDTPAPSCVVQRLAGSDRVATSLAIADELKMQMGGTGFGTIIVASALNFPDALTGSYLAASRAAPILLTYEGAQDQIISYIEKNLYSGGTVYILGGTSAVSTDFEDRLTDLGIFSRRLSGTDRMGTNLAILRETGLYSGAPILVCTAYGFADSLSASATGCPILLVGSSLTEEQKTFLSEIYNDNFLIIGGTSAVSAAVEQELSEFGYVGRLNGSSRYETSIMVAQAFFDVPRSAILAYARNYPDGLCAGPLASYQYTPLILTDDHSPADADAFIESLSRGYVVGGSSLISDDTVRQIFDFSENDVIIP